MIRRTFLKALMASPLGFLIPKTRSGTRKLIGTELEAAEYAQFRLKAERRRAKGSESERYWYWSCFQRHQLKDQDYEYTRMPRRVRVQYPKKTCGGASLDFLKDVQNWNCSTGKWESAFDTSEI